MEAERAAMAEERAEMDRFKAEKKAREDAEKQQRLDLAAEEQRQHQAKANRAQAVQIRIDAINAMHQYHQEMGSGSETLQGAINSLNALTLTDAFFEDRVAEAEGAVSLAIEALTGLRDAALQREAEAAEKDAARQREREAAAARIRADALVRDLAPQMLAALQMTMQDANFASLTRATQSCLLAVASEVAKAGKP